MKKKESYSIQFSNPKRSISTKLNETKTKRNKTKQIEPILQEDK